MPNAAEDDIDRVQREALAFLKDPERRRHWRSFYELVHAVPPVYLGHKEWLLAGRDDVLTAMGDEGAELTARYPATLSPSLNELFLGMLPFESGVYHRRLRSLVRPLFSTAAMSQLHAHLSNLMDELLYPAVFEAEGCDVLATLGVRVPERVSCLLLDVMPADWDAIGYWSRTMYKQLGRYDQSGDEIREAEAAYRDFRAYVRSRMNGQRGTRYGGVGEALLSAWRNGDLDDAQLLSYFALFLLTGLDTLTYAIGNSLWFLGNSPKVFATLRRSPELIDIAFGEAMRLWGPIRLCVRHLERAVRVGGETIPEGTTVFLLVHAANRDPRRLEKCDELLWDRRGREDLAFGVGPHACLGTAVGRLAGRTLYRTLTARCESLWVTPDPDDAQFIPSQPILGIESIRLFADPDPGWPG